VLKRKFWCDFFVDILRVIKYCVKNTQNIWWIRKIVVTLYCVKVTQIKGLLIRKKKAMGTDINRFVKAQEEAYSGYAQALNEIKAWRKTSHWIWYIFPQLKGLGRSGMADFYGIVDREEAEQYLNHDVLGARIREITEALLEHKGKSALDILGDIDAMKVKSCMTMFDCISPNDIFAEVLNSFYKGVRCHRTIRMMQK
jgi:uncharacterized protein (DUF1810 family)